MKYIPREDMFRMIGKVVYIEQLKIISIPKMAYPSVVFGWGFKNPFADSQNFKNDVVHNITVVQPSALAKNTAYWNLEDYESTWVAYKKDVYKRQ